MTTTDVRHVLLEGLQDVCETRFLQPVVMIPEPDKPSVLIRFASGIVIRVDVTAVEVLRGN